MGHTCGRNVFWKHHATVGKHTGPWTAVGCQKTAKHGLKQQKTAAPTPFGGPSSGMCGCWWAKLPQHIHFLKRFSLVWALMSTCAAFGRWGLPKMPRNAPKSHFPTNLQTQLLHRPHVWPPMGQASGTHLFFERDSNLCGC